MGTHSRKQICGLAQKDMEAPVSRNYKAGLILQSLQRFAIKQLITKNFLPFTGTYS